MKIKNSSRFVRNILYENSDTIDEYYVPARIRNEPFREISNTQISNDAKALTKYNQQPTQQFIPKAFSQEIGMILVSSCTNNQQKSIENAQVDENLGLPKISKHLLNLQWLEQSEQSDEQNNFPDTSDAKQKIHDLQNNSCFENSNSIEKREQGQNEKLQTAKIIETKNYLQSQSRQQKREEQQIASATFHQTESFLITRESMFQQLEDHKLKCLLRRDKQNSEGNIQYNLYLQDTFEHLLTVKKEGLWQYCFYLREKKVGGLFNYIKIATMQSTFFSNTFTLLKQKESNSQITIHYQTNVLGLGGPRKIEIFLPKTIIPSQYLDDLYTNKKWEGKIQKFTSKTPKWNQKIKAYVLNLHGRASVSSIKNFVITDKQESEEKSFVIFGKIGPDVYHLDICRPFSIIQGVAVAITSFEKKIVCDR